MRVFITLTTYHTAPPGPAMVPRREATAEALGLRFGAVPGEALEQGAALTELLGARRNRRTEDLATTRWNAFYNRGGNRQGAVFRCFLIFWRGGALNSYIRLQNYQHLPTGLRNGGFCRLKSRRW